MRPDGVVTVRTERLRAEDRLRRRADYLHCYRRGRRLHGALATVHAAGNREGRPRLGVTAARKVGGSVVRQRLKRRVREIYRRWEGRYRLPAADIVVHLKPSAAAAGFGELKPELERLFEGVTRPPRRRSGRRRSRGGLGSPPA